MSESFVYHFYMLLVKRNLFVCNCCRS